MMSELSLQNGTNRDVIFLDLATTGLPSKESNKTCITELSMLILKPKHMLEPGAEELPRVQHKLTMCFNPAREISPEAAELSGLTNLLLQDETLFNRQVFNIINSLIQCQKKPVCLVAHNGIDLDFPILKNHFEKLGETLDSDVMCSDSFYAFYDKLKESHVVDQQDPNNVLPRTIAELTRMPFYGRDPKPRESFRNIYERVVGPVAHNPHRAETDCVMMAETATAKAASFVEWINGNHCAFSDVTAMPIG